MGWSSVPYPKTRAVLHRGDRATTALIADRDIAKAAWRRDSCARVSQRARPSSAFGRIARASRGRGGTEARLDGAISVLRSRMDSCPAPWHEAADRDDRPPTRYGYAGCVDA